MTEFNEKETDILMIMNKNPEITTYGICKELNRNRTHVDFYLHKIYEKTAKVINYGSDLRKFISLRNYIADNGIISLFGKSENQGLKDELEEITRLLKAKTEQCNNLREENSLLKKQIAKLLTEIGGVTHV